uniref:Ribosomal protein S7 n=1 Tax=Aureoumbra lagunensis TaxID=44058 RepID=A0A7U0KS86_9STRA|nr:ribosomal protein S7 [Aureoumbra lagunensis]QQW50422.1 ribosomal protein S7 [Aureoumbra lagunensis]
MLNNTYKQKFFETLCKIRLKKGLLEKHEQNIFKFAKILRKTEKSCFLEQFFCLLPFIETLVNLKKTRLRGVSIQIPFFLKKSKRKFGTTVFKKVVLNKKNLYKELLFDRNSSKNEFKEYKKKFYDIANYYKGFASYRWFI